MYIYNNDDAMKFIRTLFSGYPKPTGINWFKDNTPISQIKRRFEDFQVKKWSLVIKNLT